MHNKLSDFIEKHRFIHKYQILTTDISDHYPIFHMIRLINDSNLDKYINVIQNYEWALLTKHRSCQAAFIYFSDILTRIFNESFPLPCDKG